MRIHAGNLPFSTTEDELRAFFGRHGSVTSAAIVIDRETARPRGFGFVEMANDGEAKKAIAAAPTAAAKAAAGKSLPNSDAQQRSPQTPSLWALFLVESIDLSELTHHGQSSALYASAKITKSVSSVKPSPLKSPEGSRRLL
jgi:RNA recognition motif-containing protein